MAKKYIRGLFEFEQESYTNARQLRFCGLKIFHTKVDVSKFKETTFLLGIRLFSRNVQQRFVRRWMKNLYQKYPNYDSYFIFDSWGVGEVFVLWGHAYALIEKYKVKNPLFVVGSNKHKQMFSLFNFDFPVVLETDLTGIFLPQESTYCEKKFINLLNAEYFNQTEKNILNNRDHYYLSLCRQFNLSSVPQYPSIKDIENNYCHFQQKIPKEKYAFLMPEAATTDELPSFFWNDVINSLLKQGYKVYINSNNPSYQFKGSQQCFFSFDKAIIFASHASLLVGVRCGLFEIILQLKSIPAIVIYNDFKPITQNFLTSEQVKSGFSLKFLPINNQSHIKEVIWKADNPSEIIRVISEM